MPQQSYVQTLNPPMRLFLMTMILVFLGIVMVYSASMDGDQLRKQVIFSGVGLACMFGAYAVDYHVWKKLAIPLLIISFLLCLAIFIPGVAPKVNGARRWVRVGGFFQFQPSELAKLAMVIYMAKMLDKNRDEVKYFWSGLVPAVALLAGFASVILIEPDFGATFTLGVVIFGMWWAGGMRKLHLAGLCIAALPAAALAFLMASYRAQRLFAFLFPDAEGVRKGVGWQLHQSLIAVGSGGVWGQGLGNSSQKLGFLDEAHNDFIFAILCEELGFVWIGLFLFVYMLFIIHGLLVAWRTTDLFGSMLAAGITLMIFVSSSIHMGVVLGLLPTKGLVLPFISAGGSSLIICMTGMGILMNVARSSYAQHSAGLEELT